MKQLQGFFEFIRTQGVVGLAVGFILGGAVSKVVSSVVNDIINPIIGMIFGSTKGLSEAALTLNGVSLRWGNFISVAIDFIIVAAVVYFGVKKLGIEKLDKPKE